MSTAKQYGSPTDPVRGNTGGNSRTARTYGQKTRDAQEPETKKEDPTPPARVVAQFHTNADTDARREAIHHTLGPTGSQASPGDHNHDGGSSKAILEGFNLTGSKASPTTMWPSILACLVRLGADDNTTA